MPAFAQSASSAASVSSLQQMQSAAGSWLLVPAARLLAVLSSDRRCRRRLLTFNTDVTVLAARARANWMQFSLDIDYAAAPEVFVISGDMEDFSQDLEARLSYQLPQRDMSLFAGVRYSVFHASGDANGFRYENDMIIDGFQFGVAVTF